MGKRYAVFYLIGCVASAFGGILAYGLMHMQGLRGYGGWRWIFIIEGVVSFSDNFEGVLTFTDANNVVDLSRRWSWLYFPAFISGQYKIPLHPIPNSR